LVTARRREESLQEVPATVSVVSNEDMFVRGLDSMDRLRDTVPNFQFAADYANRSRMAVRGLGSDRSGTQTNPVGFFIDGVYQAGVARFSAPFFDVERVEILKGPQGARYGRNAFAGVVNVVTRKPGNELHASAQTVVENKGGFEYAGLLSGPIVRDRLYGKLSFAHNETDGDYKHAISGKNMASLESDFYSARLIWDATDNLEFDLNLGKTEVKGIAFALSQVDTLQQLRENYLVRDDQFSGSDYEDASLTATWSGERVTVMNRLAYRDTEIRNRLDGDGIPYDGIQTDGGSDSEYLSNELRISSSGGGKLQWMFGGEVAQGESESSGLTYFHEEIDLALLGFPFPPLRNQLMGISPVAGSSSGDSDYWSVFGEVSYEFMGRMELLLSVRYDNIEKSVTKMLGGSPLSSEFEDDAVQPLVSMRYKLSDDTSVYASAARGFREGGFNVPALTRDYGTYASDDVWSYEIGFKHLLNRWRGQVNASAFYMDADVLNHAAVLINDTGGIASGVITLGGASSWGVEVDTTIQLTDFLTWTAAVGLLDCQLQDVPPYDDRTPDQQRAGRGIQSGNQCSDSAKWTFNTALSGEYPLARDDTSLMFTLSFSGKGKQRLASDPLLREEESIQDPYYLLDLTAGMRTGRWSIFGYAENLTNERYALDNSPAAVFHEVGVGGATGSMVTLAPKRRYGIKIRFDF